MADEGGNIVKFRGQTINHIGNQILFRDRRVNIIKKIRNGFNAGAIRGDGLVTKRDGTQFVVKLYGLCVFVITKKAFEVEPYLTSGGVSFKNHLKKGLGDGTIYPKFDD